MDAMRGIAVARKSITSTVIQNCFSKCDFGIEDAIVTEEDDQDNSDWVELQGHVDCPSNFDEFLNVDQLIPTPKTIRQQVWTSLTVSKWRMSRKRRGRGCSRFQHVPTRKDAFTALLVLDTVR
jgi:hypothetical protein